MAKIQLNSTGPAVEDVQKRLQKLGFYSGSVDGQFGYVTQAAVIAFQASCSLPADGIVDTKTLAALQGKTKKEKKTVVKKNKKKKGTKVVTKETGRWNGHTFIVSPDRIFSFNDLQIKASSEMISKEDWDQGYVSRKGGNPFEVTLTVYLHAHAGVDVRTEARGFLSDAYNGSRDYFYVGNKKLVSSLLMLTDASVKNIQIAGNGKSWLYAEVALTLKQCKAYDNVETDKSSSSGFGNSGGSNSGSSYTGGSNSGDGGYKQSVDNTPPPTEYRISKSSTPLENYQNQNQQIQDHTHEISKSGQELVTKIKEKVPLPNKNIQNTNTHQKMTGMTM